MATDSASNVYPASPVLSERAYRVRDLGERLIAAQRPIRVLDAVHWDTSVERAYFAAGGRELPPVSRDYYGGRPLRFDPAEKTREFLAIEADVRRLLGRDDPAARLLSRRCREYRHAVELLDQRGTPEFARLSRELYGAPDPAEAVELVGLCATLTDGLQSPAAEAGPTLDAESAVRRLAERLGRSFPRAATVHIRLSDDILADAAAGSDYIKLRRDAHFSPRDLAMLEVHEGWVHLGTTLNGQRQPVCGFLGKGTPATTRTQEGLAVLAELLAGVSHAERLRQVWRRYEAVRMAANGADFRDIFRYFLAGSDDPHESYQRAQRVFRGSLPAGCGPFTKDVCYIAGLARVLDVLRGAVASGRPRAVALLFSGKTGLHDLPVLEQLADDGLLAPPAFVPPPFANPAALAARLDGLLAAPEPAAVGKNLETLRPPLVTCPALGIS
jgi:uncharacterized protein (TIGR02421 family)